MMFFKKNKEVVLDCFTYLPHAYDYAKIDFATKFFPEWWKKTPKVDSDIGTIKSCVGLMDFFKKGIVIPSWFENDFTVFPQDDPDRRWWVWDSSYDGFSTSESHPPEQFLGFAGATGKNIKINSPWLFKTKEEVFFTWTQPTWNLRSLVWNFSVLPAVTSYKYQHWTNINLFVDNKEEEKTWTIPAQTPLVILHPLTERNIKIKTHLVSENEWNRINGAKNLVLTKTSEQKIKEYQKKKNIIDSAVCPYHNK